METTETNHSRKIRRILNSTEKACPALDWSLRSWLPIRDSRVQFIINTETFHGVICIDVDYKSSEVFIIGCVDFLTNIVSKSLLIHQSELVDFINVLDRNNKQVFERIVLAPHRAPKFDGSPNSPENEYSF